MTMLRRTHLLLAVFALSIAAGEMDNTSQNWRKPTVSEVTRLFPIAPRGILERMLLEAAVDSSLKHDTELAEALNETSLPQEKKWLKNFGIALRITRGVIGGFESGFRDEISIQWTKRIGSIERHRSVEREISAGTGCRENHRGNQKGHNSCG